MLHYTKFFQFRALTIVLTGLLSVNLSTTSNAQTYQAPTANEYAFPGGVSGGQSLHSSNYLYQDFTLAAYDDENDGQVIWQMIDISTTNMICGGSVNYAGGYSHLEVGALMGSSSGAPFTAFVAYHKVGTGHAVDLYDWDPFACTMTYNTTHTLSTNPNPSRISMDCHIDYALAIGWEDAGTLNTTVYETGMFGPSFIHTITPTIKPNNVDVAFTHGTQLWVHYVYNSLGTPQIEVAAEDFWVMRAATFPTTYIPVYEDLNTLTGASAGNVFCSIDGADHLDDNWAYAYTEDHQNISVRLIDVGMGIPPTTFVVNDGSMGNLANNFSRNWAPILSYDFSFQLINVGWISTNSGQSYIGLEIMKDGSGISSNLDYFQIPNIPAAASPTPVLAYSKMTEFSMPWLYAFFPELNAANTHEFIHKYHDMTNNANFKNGSSHLVTCPDYQHGGHRATSDFAQAMEKLEIYPNPFDDQFTIDDSKMKLSGELMLTLEDISGKVVFQSKGSLDAVNSSLRQKINKLESGSYILDVSTSDKEYNQSWKVQKR